MSCLLRVVCCCCSFMSLVRCMPLFGIVCCLLFLVFDAAVVVGLICFGVDDLVVVCCFLLMSLFVRRVLFLCIVYIHSCCLLFVCLLMVCVVRYGCLFRWFVACWLLLYVICVSWSVADVKLFAVCCCWVCVVVVRFDCLVV